MNLARKILKLIQIACFFIPFLDDTISHFAISKFFIHSFFQSSINSIDDLIVPISLFFTMFALLFACILLSAILSVKKFKPIIIGCNILEIILFIILAPKAFLFIEIPLSIVSFVMVFFSKNEPNKKILLLISLLTVAVPIVCAPTQALIMSNEKHNLLTEHVEDESFEINYSTITIRRINNEFAAYFDPFEKKAARPHQRYVINFDFNFRNTLDSYNDLIDETLQEQEIICFHEYSKIKLEDRVFYLYPYSFKLK